MFPSTNNNPSAVRLLSDTLIAYFMSRWGESRICGVFIWRIGAAALRRVGVTSASPSVAFRGGPCRRGPRACRDSGDTARSLRWTWWGSKADIGCSAPAPPKRLWIKLPRTAHWPGKGVVEDEGIFSGMSDFELPLDGLFMRVAASQWNQDLRRTKRRRRPWHLVIHLHTFGARLRLTVVLLPSI